MSLLFFSDAPARNRASRFYPVRFSMTPRVARICLEVPDLSTYYVAWRWREPCGPCPAKPLFPSFLG